VPSSFFSVIVAASANSLEDQMPNRAGKLINTQQLDYHECSSTLDVANRTKRETGIKAAAVADEKDLKQRSK